MIPQRECGAKAILHSPGPPLRLSGSNSAHVKYVLSSGLGAGSAGRQVRHVLPDGAWVPGSEVKRVNDVYRAPGEGCQQGRPVWVWGG